MKKLIFTITVFLVSLIIFAVNLGNPINISNEWTILGPMHIAPREGISSVPFFSDIDKYSKKTFNYRFFEGKDIEFFTVNSDDGRLHLEGDTIPFLALQDAFGFSGVLNQYYAFNEIESETSLTGIVYAGGVSSFYVNGKKYIGDAYDFNRVYSPVDFKRGKNSISFVLSGYYSYADAYIEIYTIGDPFVFNEKEAVLFDIIRDSIMSEFISVQAVNSSYKDIEIKIRISEKDTNFIFEEKNVKIPHLGIKNIPIRVSMKNPISKGDKTQIKLSIDCGDFSKEESLEFKVSNIHDVRRETFISETDSSIQYYAVRLPEEFSENSVYPLIISLHGAGVKAEGQASAYRESKTSILCCPTNRGEYGFDWQELGRIDFLEAKREIEKKYHIDKERISLTGHSMGGHGTMYLGSLYAQYFSSITPASGWINFNTYMPQTFQRVNLFDNKEARECIDILKDGDNPLVFVENLRNTQVLLIHGGADDNVPVFQSRIFYNTLKSNGIRAEVCEYENEGHWFDIPKTEGIDCIDSDEIRIFIEKSRKQRMPRESLFKTFSLLVSDSSDYASIDRQIIKYEASLIDIKLGLREILIETKNVEGFSLYGMDGIYNEKIDVIINGDLVRAKPKGVLSFCLNKNKFKLSNEKAVINNYSLINYAFFSPFAIVYSTADSIADITYGQAINLFNTYSVKCRGVCEIISDSSEEEFMGKNIIFIGIPKEKTKWRRVFDDLAIKIDEEKISDGKRVYKGRDLSFVFCKSTKDKTLKAAFIGNSIKGQETSLFFSPLTSSPNLPEYLLFDERVFEEGFNGIIKCGFY